MIYKALISKFQTLAIVVALPISAVTAPLSAEAFSFTSIYALSDSLSDTGNLYAATGNLFPPATIYPSNGRFSNGIVWTEYLAPKFNTPLQTLALGGSRSDNTNQIPGLPGLAQQVNAISVGDPNALYVLWAGANDYLNARRTDPVPTVTNLSNAVLALATVGAKNIAVGNLPNLGALPGTSGDPVRATGLNQLTQAHNSLLAQSLSVIRQTQPDVNLFTLDFNFLFSDAISNPNKYGLTNVTDSCLLTGCTTPNTYLFWDEIHPTTAGHAQISEFAYASIQAQAVPEPSVVIGVLLGGAFLTRVKKHRRNIP